MSKMRVMLLLLKQRFEFSVTVTFWNVVAVVVI